jgi:hypothetical protein
MSFRDFDHWLQEKQGGRPEFVIAGQKFTARAKLPWRKFASLILTMAEEDITDTVGLKKAEEFMSTVLVSRDKERFLALLEKEDVDDDDDEDNCITADQVIELSEWLVEYYTGRGKEIDGPSSDSPSPSGEPAKLVSLNPLPEDKKK